MLIFQSTFRIFLYVIFFLLVRPSISAGIPITSIKLNQTVNSSINKDEGYEYYSLVIPSTVKFNESMLMFTVKADESNIKEGEEIFSDPDLYVSKNEKYPNSPVNSQWYSERYGSDILSISSSNVGPNETFYIGMYCQFKCKYSLRAYLSTEIELLIGKVYTLYISKKTSMNYFIKIPDKDYKEFNILATSPMLKEFKIFIHQVNPSSQNTYPVMPSWAGGYMVTIEKGSPEYCKKCVYHIVIQGGEEEDSTVQISPYFQETVSHIKDGNPIYDSIKEHKKRCYKFKISERDIAMNENVIIQTTLFSGHLDLYIGGWKDLTDLTYINMPSDNYSYHITSERVVLLNKTDYDYFSNKTTVSSQKKHLNFCVFSTMKTSYIISLHYLSQAEEIQKFNFIMPENEINGYLKGHQATRYRILDFKNQADISVVHEEIQGKSSLYAFFCNSSKCYITYDSIKSKLDKNEFITSLNTYSGHELFIPNKENKCRLALINKLYCQTLIVVACEDETFCSYKLRVSFNETSLRMVPKSTYYNLLPAGQTDNYEILVTDETINSIVIVLNTASGDAELIVFAEKTEGNFVAIGVSLNNDYIPDVVRITTKHLKTIKGLNWTKDNLVGKYKVKIATKSFSTYNLYYYTTFEHTTTKISNSDITIELTEGDIILDHFPNDMDFKVYSFVLNAYPNKQKEDIRIVLTKMNIPFSFRVYLSLESLEIKNQTVSQYEERFKGFVWTSDYNGELTISKNDPKYSLYGPYYIIVIKDIAAMLDKEVEQKAVGSYYLGATTESIPFILYEGKYHSSTLKNSYPKQIYWYSHTNITQNLELSINVYNGAVDVYVDAHEISRTDLANESKKENLAAFKEKITYYEKITIPASYFADKCKLNTYNCGVYIFVKKGLTDYDGQYLLVGKSSKTIGEVITPGLVKTDSVKEGEYKHYIIEEMQKRKGSTISITFFSGDGEIYLRIPEKPEVGDKIKYPNETFYDFKGIDHYMGKIIKIPSSYFQKINDTNIKIQLLISVLGTYGVYTEEGEKDEGKSTNSSSSDECTYIISYSSEAKRINQNVPYFSSIQSGESQYFSFYFDNDVSNIYISLSNMNGDADLYLNYGESNYPTPSEADWYSMNTNHEFIDIRKDDPVFQQKNLTEIGGYYTLLIYGYINTTYSLFVSAHDNLIMPLYDNSPISCKCVSTNDKCYFRYADFYESLDGKEDDDIQIIFTTQYTYGTGMMYAKLYEDIDIFDTEKNIYENFPSESLYDFSNKDSNQRNYMKVKIQKKNNPNYNKDSILLLTLKCLEPSLVDLNTATLKGDEFDYLDQNRENIFYLKKDTNPTYLVYYNYGDKDLIYEAHGYLGNGRIEIFINDTALNNQTNKVESKVTTFNDILIGTTEIGNYKITQVGVIKTNQNINQKNIYFRVTPYEDFGFYIKLTYSRKWTNIPINKAKQFFVQKGELFGYFDIQDEYHDVEISVVLDDHVNKVASMYAKINIITKNGTSVVDEDESSIYNYSVPKEENCDYKQKTDLVLGSMVVKMTNLPKMKKHYKYIRVLLYIKVEDYNYEKDKNDENEYVYDDEDFLDKATNASLTIVVTPCTNSYKRIDTAPFVYYFSNETSKSENETKIYHLERMRSKDDVLIIEISSCSGDYEYSLSENLATYYEDPTLKTVKTYDRKKNGRHTITVIDLKSKHYYLTVRAKPDSQCDGFGGKCDNTNYMMYYYTTTSNEYKQSVVNSTFEYEPYGRGGVKLLLPEIHERDSIGRVRNMSNITFNVFISTKKEEFEQMESVCYLTNMTKRSESKLYKNIKVVNNNTIIIKGLSPKEKYYVNILAENIITRELITFKPILIVSGGSMPGWIIIAFVLILIGVISVAIFFYKKYIITKKILKYETSDVRNMSEIPKTEAELANIVQQREKVKYVNLTENGDKV